MLNEVVNKSTRKSHFHQDEQVIFSVYNNDLASNQRESYEANQFPKSCYKIFGSGRRT